MSAQVFTTKEGESESEFQFNEWITQNGLDEIKDLFIKHNATEPNTWSLTSPQFASLLSDPQLLTNKAYMIPKIMKALQSIPVHSTESNQKRHVVITMTEAEETAMTDAKLQCDDIDNDIGKFDKMIISTNKNYKQSVKYINDQFDEMIKALKQRQKQLLSKLEGIKKDKINAFESQLQSLKSYIKEYNDLNNKWDKMFIDNKMERNERKRQIVHESDDIIAKSQRLKNENKRILNSINDEFSTKFEESKSFVDSFGDVGDGSSLKTPSVKLPDTKSNLATIEVKFSHNEEEKKMDNEACEFEANLQSIAAMEQQQGQQDKFEEERQHKEQEEKERKLKEEQERQQKLERESKEKEESERREKLERERREKEERERQQKVEQERKQKEERERKEREEKERQQRLVQEKKEKEERERQQKLEREKQEKLERERKEKEELGRQQKLKQEQEEREKQQKLQQEQEQEALRQQKMEADKQRLEEQRKKQQETNDDVKEESSSISYEVRSRGKLEENIVSNRNSFNNKTHFGIAVIGDCNSGKSTTTGRLLFELGGISEKDLEKSRKEARDLGKESFSFAFIMDKSKEERAREVTIACTIKEFVTESYHYSIIDAPGHRDFISNMISGASQADVALLIVPADKGGFEKSMAKANHNRGLLEGQTRQHARLCFLSGIEQLIVGINKMDDKSVNYSQGRYEEIKTELDAMLTRIGFKTKKIPFIPMSGFKGDNLAEKSSNMPWYDGFKVTIKKEKISGITLVDALEKAIKPPRRPGYNRKPFRMPVSAIYKIKGIGDMIIGRIEQGTITPGANVKFYPTGCSGNVFSIEMHHKSVEKAQSGYNVCINIRELPQNNMPRVGDVMAIEYDNKYMDPCPPRAVAQFSALVFVQGDPDLKLSCGVQEKNEKTGEIEIRGGCTPIIHIRTAKAPCQMVEIRWKMGKSTSNAKVERVPFIGEGDQAEVVFKPRIPFVVQPFNECKPLGRFAAMECNSLIMLGKVTKVTYV